ncbi:CheY chemotaxis protein or a CheY-like REC (receiver) domain [Chitinophaga terrae (ex Kim and Jung 2007)]|uniref:CheY chemotaxis protein or a CheY-like REC (Receiver) domain n=1 Tax=Chitinophaga terrae (ex Kim and Jung 2007) TaxID=408074 RepID=A0A1H3WWM6_9BACT|nr:response regulator [Chitinophaga terrae (ex Kim and Jung 2007)]MDQ0107060.1 CheY-like chemotaxis protein [Chitinophaga terrae (ex Kim and Jung 2007)]SDZ90732.1 CheY chemotaxis protein or a CheY-like REC (receiver) domain [Chitinophaga terrae (ex Kim and Jung 2007)]
MNNRITSLLIDEKPDQRIQFYLSLDLLNVSRACVCHDNLKNALEYLQEKTDFTPNYIFISSSMPVDAAAQFIRIIRQAKRLANVPVIYFADANSKVSSLDLKGAGFTDSLRKQPDIYLLRDALSALFTKSYAPQETDTMTLMLRHQQPVPKAPHRLSA